MELIHNENFQGECTVLDTGFVSQPELSATQQQALRALLEDGLPIATRPYQVLAEQIGSDEATVMSQIDDWQDEQLIKRFGLVVKHHQLGYRANAMVVWNIADDQVDDIGEKFKQSGRVSLCYRRPRRGEHWPYNLFCMIHGKERQAVEQQVQALVADYGLKAIEHKLLFSTRQFKQRGGRFARPNVADTGERRRG